MIHALKTIQPYFSQVESGDKNFQLRKDDRPFKEGDTIVLQEFGNDGYTGREVHFKIGYILRNVKQFGLKDGYCILGLKEKETY